MATLDKLASESIVTRSQLVERTLITFCNLDPRVHLDMTGRKSEGTNEPHLLATPADFARRWRGFAAARAAALGRSEEDDMPEGPDDPPPPRRRAPK